MQDGWRRSARFINNIRRKKDRENFDPPLSQGDINKIDKSIQFDLMPILKNKTIIIECQLLFYKNAYNIYIIYDIRLFDAVAVQEISITKNYMERCTGIPFGLRIDLIPLLYNVELSQSSAAYYMKPGGWDLVS